MIKNASFKILFLSNIFFLNLGGLGFWKHLHLRLVAETKQKN